MRIVVADQQAAARSALILLLKQEPYVNAIDEAADGQELLAQLEIACPNLLLLDWNLPGRPAVGQLRNLCGCQGRFQVVILGSHEEDEQSAMEAGADYFVLKGNSPKRLLTAVRAARLEGDCV